MPRYEKAPLVQVWIAFEFDPSSDKKEWDLNLVEKFAKANKRDFPKIDALLSEEIKVEPSTDGNLPKIVDRKEKIDLVRMTSEDGSRMRQLGDDRIAFNLLSTNTEYLGFEPLIRNSVEYLESYRDEFQPTKVRSASIHHTDVIELPIEDEALEVSDYFNAIPDVPADPFGHTIGFTYSFRAKCPHDEQILKVSLNMIPSGSPNVIRIMVDWDKTCNGFNFSDLEAAKGDLTASHEYMVKCFEALITEKTRSLFSPRI